MSKLIEELKAGDTIIIDIACVVEVIETMENKDRRPYEADTILKYKVIYCPTEGQQRVGSKVSVKEMEN